MTVSGRPAEGNGDETVPDERDALELTDICAGYGGARVLDGVSLRVPAGRVACLLGPNGAGKTTLLRTAVGQLRPTRGSVRLGGEEVNGVSPAAMAARGLCLIPEGRGIFRSLTVEENLRLFQLHPKAGRVDIDVAFQRFPALKSRARLQAGRLSGGQQQMLAIARAYLAEPRCILIDEISMGLAPIIVDAMYDTIGELAAQGTALLIVEQYVQRALAIADHAVLLRKGTVAYSGPPAGLDAADLTRSYIGAE
jgi:branched-chain amino acid transport system ATP-binding protein